MGDLLAAINTVLLPLSAVYLYFFVKYQYMTTDHEKPRDVALYSWSVCCMALAVFLSSILFFLYDFDLIYESTRIKLGVMPRSLFVASLLLAYVALDLQWRRTIILLSTLAGIIVFILKVVL